MINVEILKKELLKQDSVESCFNDEYREMMACIAGAVDCSIEKIERFLTDYGRLTRINQMTYVSREHETKEEFYKMPHKKRKGRIIMIQIIFDEEKDRREGILTAAILS